MAKFGKFFKKQKNKVEEFKEKYLNYKGLKQIIKRMKNKMKEKENVDSLNYNIKEFTEELDKEIKKVFIFFANRERTLYKEINKHLYIRNNYEQFEIGNYLNEFSKLYDISVNSLNLSEFVYYNNVAIMKILKKFDHKIIGPKDTENYISKGYIQNKLEEQNSDIIYMLKFKMIDEVNVLVDDLIHILKREFFNNKSTLSKIPSQEDNQGKLLEVVPDFTESSNRILNSYKDIKKKIKTVDSYAMKIKQLYIPWDNYLKISGELSNKLLQLKEMISDEISINTLGSNESSHSLNPLSSLYNKTSTFMKNIFFSKENRFNIFIIFSQSFLFNLSYSVVIPSNINYIEFLGYPNYCCGIIMAMTPLGMLFSLSYGSICFKRTTKYPMIFSLSLMTFGNFIYGISRRYNNIILILLGRFLLGISNNRINNKMYLTNFLPKTDVINFTSYFHYISILGLFCGFGLNTILYYFTINNGSLNKYTYGTWISGVLSLLLCVFSIFLFKEAHDNSFSITQFINDVNNENQEEEIRRESIMINDINNQLGNFNRKSNYNDTNLVQASIDDITIKEKETLQYLYKPFFVFLSFAFTSKIIYESLIVFITIYCNSCNYSYNFPAILLSFSIILLFIFEFISIKILKKVTERDFVYFLMLLIGLLNLLNLFFYEKLIMLILPLLISFSYLEEKISANFFSRVILNDFIFCNIQGNVVISIFGIFGRTIGALLIILIGKYQINEIIIMIHGLLSVLCIMSFIIFSYYYQDMRVKAIRRILERESQEKFMITTVI